MAQCTEKRQSALKIEKDFLGGIAELKSTKLGETVFCEHDALDSKTSALLTHVSLMLAVLSIFYGSMKNEPAINIMVSVELLAYLLIALCCLRAIDIKGPASTDLDREELLAERITTNRARRRFYKFSLVSTIVVTIIVVPTIIFHIIAF